MILVQNSAFVRLVLKGQREYPHRPVLLSHDFRRPSALFDWLGPGTIVRIESPDLNAVRELASIYGKWVALTTLRLE